MSDDQIAAKISEMACNEAFAFVSRVPNPSKRDIHERVFRSVSQKFAEHGQLLHSLEIETVPNKRQYTVTVNKKHTWKFHTI